MTGALDSVMPFFFSAAEGVLVVGQAAGPQSRRLCHNHEAGYAGPQWLQMNHLKGHVMGLVCRPHGDQDVLGASLRDRVRRRSVHQGVHLTV